MLTLTASGGLALDDFKFTNAGGWYTAAKVQGIPNADSGEIGANVIPEPSTYALRFGGFALSVVVLRKKLGKKTKES